MLGRPGTSIQLLNVSDWSQIEIVFDLNLLTRLIFLIFWQVVAGVGEVEERRIYLGGGEVEFHLFLLFCCCVAWWQSEVAERIGQGPPIGAIFFG